MTFHKLHIHLTVHDVPNDNLQVSLLFKCSINYFGFGNFCGCAASISHGEFFFEPLLLLTMTVRVRQQQQGSSMSANHARITCANTDFCSK